jgi:23S rRNA (cytidine1920-2'-O)/16S rRNA (cytidine1409-2'-O)-methyltransferase
LEAGGVVRDPRVHREVLREALAAIIALGLTPRALELSPLRGPAGNAEFFVLIAREGVAVGEAEIEGLTAQHQGL